MNNWDKRLKNPRQENLSKIKLSDFLESRVVALFDVEGKLHQKDLANRFCQQVRFGQEFLWAAVDGLLKKGILARPPRSPYLLIKKKGGLKHG